MVCFELLAELAEDLNLARVVEPLAVLAETARQRQAACHHDNCLGVAAQAVKLLAERDGAA